MTHIGEVIDNKVRPYLIITDQTRDFTFIQFVRYAETGWAMKRYYSDERPYSLEEFNELERTQWNGLKR